MSDVTRCGTERSQDRRPSDGHRPAGVAYARLREDRCQHDREERDERALEVDAQPPDRAVGSRLDCIAFLSDLDRCAVRRGAWGQGGGHARGVSEGDHGDQGGSLAEREVGLRQPLGRLAYADVVRLADHEAGWA